MELGQGATFLRGRGRVRVGLGLGLGLGQGATFIKNIQRLI